MHHNVQETPKLKFILKELVNSPAHCDAEEPRLLNLEGSPKAGIVQRELRALVLLSALKPKYEAIYYLLD